MGLSQSTLVSQTGPPHDPEFTLQVVVDKKKMGEGVAGAKREAEQIAAKMAYEKLAAPIIARDET